jgi:hypothetical protein
VPSRFYVPTGRGSSVTRTNAEIAGVVAALADWFGEPYPYEKMDFIASTDFSYGAMENPGAIVVNERILAPPESETVAQHAQLLEVLTHELAHQWFGNLVTMAWWDDLWLNECHSHTWTVLGSTSPVCSHPRQPKAPLASGPHSIPPVGRRPKTVGPWRNVKRKTDFGLGG